ncbi:MAG: hypothetical protein E6Q62_08985 [Nitrosomonas sp.]|nr:MAG: hypothetical protein E6Q62_08985 [Nitrosomonas sp.]
MLWLPIEGGMAAVLSVCIEEKIFNDRFDKSSVAISNHHHDECHNQVEGGHVLVNLSCDDISCDAYSHTLILLNSAVTMLVNNNSGKFIFHSSFISFIPEQPQHPPLTVSF